MRLWAAHPVADHLALREAELHTARFNDASSIIRFVEDNWNLDGSAAVLLTQSPDI